MPCRGLFVTGTDTDVGKTFLSSLILRQMQAEGYHPGAYKPVCSGSERNEQGEPRWQDADILAAAVGNAHAVDCIAPQRFHAAVAPHRAARLEGKQVDEQQLDAGLHRLQEQVEWLLIEGAGGLLSPVSDSSNNADLASRWGYPLLVVARAGLGTLNHTLLTIEAAQSRDLPVVGIVLNCPPGVSAEDPSLPYNREDLARLTTVPVLGTVETGRTDPLPFPVVDLFDFARPVL